MAIGHGAVEPGLHQSWRRDFLGGGAQVAVRGRPGSGGHSGQWSKQDLVKRARKIGIKGRSTMSKGELVKALRDH